MTEKFLQELNNPTTTVPMAAKLLGVGKNAAYAAVPGRHSIASDRKAAHGADCSATPLARLTRCD